ncbi:MAG: hypothetical protein LBP74_06975 [Treponema sp.]|jgi:hypothetical protein|nr:hypothetical protein [Treponema sp.]
MDELVRTIDYILNRCDEAAIEVVAEAVVRRRRQLAYFGGSARMPDPGRMAKELAGSAGATIEGLRETVRDMAARILRREAPELSDEQIEELISSWVPGAGTAATDTGISLPPAALASMIDQFVAFSRGALNAGEEKKLRDEMGPWPRRYWESFPPVVRLIIAGYIKGEMNEKEFKSKIETAIAINA